MHFCHETNAEFSFIHWDFKLYPLYFLCIVQKIQCLFTFRGSFSHTSAKLSQDGIKTDVSSEPKCFNTNQVVTWIIPVFTINVSQTKPTTTMVNHSLKPSCLLRMQPWTIFSPLKLLVSPCYIPWACSLMLMPYFALGTYFCKGPLVDGCPTHPVCWSHASQMTWAVGFETNGHQGFLDLIVLQIRKKQQPKTQKYVP